MCKTQYQAPQETLCPEGAQRISFRANPIRRSKGLGYCSAMNCGDVGNSCGVVGRNSCGDVGRRSRWYLPEPFFIFLAKCLLPEPI